MGRFDRLLQFDVTRLRATESRAENPFILPNPGQISDLQASEFRSSSSRASTRRVSDPLPVTFQPTLDSNRPPSRLDNPVPIPLVRPQAVNPRRRRGSGPPDTAGRDPPEGRRRRLSARNRTIERRNEGQSGSSSAPPPCRTLGLLRRTGNPPGPEPPVIPSPGVQRKPRGKQDFATWRGKLSSGSESKSDSLSESLSNDDEGERKE